MRYAFASALITLVSSCVVTASNREYGTLHGWGTLIDPDQDCSFVIQSQGVTIRVPGTAHGLSVELGRTNAPRVLQETSGDFVVEVRVDGDFQPAHATVPQRTAYQGAGLLLWQDERNYIRLERAALKRNGQLRHYANFERRVGGVLERFGAVSDYEIDASKSCWLRLQRIGQRVLGSVRQDDEPWHSLTPKSAKLPHSVKVGVAAVNASDTLFSPQFTELKLQSGGLKVTESETDNKPDPYAVPDSNIEDLIAFIQEIRTKRPRTRDEYMAHAARAPQALTTAAKRILESDEASESQRETARRVLLSQQLQSLSRLNEVKQRELADEIFAFCRNGEADEENWQLAYTLARSLESAKRMDLAAEAYETASELMATSKSQALVKRAEKLAGAARRLRLLGNEIDLHGQLVDGSELDPERYRGKVVLVDFWATWCGPCIAELPNVKKYYTLYHDKGFEVLGISLDTHRERLEKFLEDREIPWANLYQDDAGWDHPMANQYGVMAIPTVFLVNREGKVISLRARGDELGRLLQEELGPVDPERLREVEQKMREESRAAANISRRPRSAPERANLAVDKAIYVACGAVNGGGKIYQLDGRGQILGSVDLPATAYGIDVSAQGVIAALPRLGLSRISPDGTHTRVAETEIERAIDVARLESADGWIVADNHSDQLWKVSADPEIKPVRIQSLPGEPARLQNLDVDVTRNGQLLLATGDPEGVFRFDLTPDAPLGEPIVDRAGGIASDRHSTRWAAVSETKLQVFDHDEPVAEIPFPSGQTVYRGGIVTALDGAFLVVVNGDSQPMLVRIDPQSKNVQSFFSWGRERLVDVAVGPRLAWDAEREANRVANASGDELSLVEFDPPLPHQFKTGERLTIKFAYKLKSGTDCHLFARPMTDGSSTPGYGAHGSPAYQRGSGEAEGWFTFSRPARIDHVRIRMVDGSTRESILELLVKAEAAWTSDD